MGLPLFITPVEPEVATKSTEKVASGPRSAIRRNRNRHFTSADAHSRMSPEARRRLVLEGMLNSEREREASENRQMSPTEQDMATESTRSTRTRLFEPHNRMMLRDSLSFERRHGPETDIDGLRLPVAPEMRASERGRWAMAHQARREIERLARRRPAPTPPYNDGEYAYITRDTPQPDSFTPALSPSRSANPPVPPLSPRALADLWSRDAGQETETAETPRESLTVSLAERARRRYYQSRVQQTRRLGRLGRMDGLGDRDRSLSPENGAAWDTLLTSITPDPQPPSAGSSFASASATAAAASYASTGSASATTSMTSLGRTDDSQGLNPPIEEPQEDSVDCNSESGSEGDLAEWEDDMPAMTRDEAVPWRSYAEVVRPREERATREYGVGDVELGTWHEIISRFAERDDIPDAWWASAGLIRNIQREASS